MSSPATDSLSKQTRISAELEQKLASLSLPALQQALDQYFADLGKPGEEPASVKAAFGEARTQLNTGYEEAKTSSALTLKQAALQSGNANNQGAVDESLGQLAKGLQQNQAGANRALNFQEANAGLNQTNNLLSSITGVGGNLLSGSFGFGRNAQQAGSLLAQIAQQNSQQGSTYGGIAGSVLGGILGSYFPVVGTAAGAAAGGAVGGVVGGWFGGRG